MKVYVNVATITPEVPDDPNAEEKIQALITAGAALGVAIAVEITPDDPPVTAEEVQAP